MGKRGGTKRVTDPQPRSRKPISMREQTAGNKQGKGGGANLKSILRHEHLKNLAVWTATGGGGEAPILPSLAAFFGRRLAADGEAAEIAPDTQLFYCQRCETVLQPGFNCNVRIEKNSYKKRPKHKKPKIPSSQNNVVYNCHFCSHKNVMRGTTKGHMKEINPTKLKKPRPFPKSPKTLPPNECVDKVKDIGIINDGALSPLKAGSDDIENGEANTPGPTLLLDRGRRKRKSACVKPVGPESNSAVTEMEKTVGGSSKRKRKSWISLKEIAEQDRSSNITNLKIPFLL